MSKANEPLEAVLQTPAGLEVDAREQVSVQVVKHTQTRRQTELTLKTTKTTLCLTSFHLPVPGGAAIRLSAAKQPPLTFKCVKG